MRKNHKCSPCDDKERHGEGLRGECVQKGPQAHRKCLHRMWHHGPGCVVLDERATGLGTVNPAREEEQETFTTVHSFSFKSLHDVETRKSTPLNLTLLHLTPLSSKRVSSFARTETQNRDCVHCAQNVERRVGD